jgi:hypothetical protein
MMASPNCHPSAMKIAHKQQRTSTTMITIKVVLRFGFSG